MLALYHGSNSVCSIKVRIVLAEKELDWESRHIDLRKGEQLTPQYLKINAAGVVPVLNHDGALIPESSVIAEYVDGLSTTNPLMPEDPLERARTRVWGIRTIGYHDAVNTLTFASYQRTMLLELPPEELRQRFATMPDKTRAAKMQDLVARGPRSDFVPVAFDRLQTMCAMIEEDLASTPYLMGERYSLAEALVTAYIFRAECIGVSGLWQNRFPRMTEWYERIKSRPSMATATEQWLDKAALDKIARAGRAAYLDGNHFDGYLV